MSTVDVTIIQGTHSAVMLPVSIPDPAGWEFHAQVRPSPGSPTLLAEWVDGQIVRHPYALILPLSPEITSEWTWTRGVLGIEGTSPTGQVSRLIQQPIALDREVVRPQEVTA